LGPSRLSFPGLAEFLKRLCRFSSTFLLQCGSGTRQTRRSMNIREKQAKAVSVYHPQINHAAKKR
jgi:hypothetical protein